jgi:poly(3-hydroxybutyrate) depolymerase
MLLDAAGHSVVFVNGGPRAGDPYSHGYVRLPVLLKKGTNELLFQCARGRIRAKLVDPEGKVFVDARDVTAPDLIEGRAQTHPFAVVHVNATTQPVVAQSQSIPPLSVRKVRHDITHNGMPEEVTHEATGVTFRVRRPGLTYKQTFISDIDGSVQYYAVNPGSLRDDQGRALVLSLHGAAVEAINQADAYSPKTWCDIVCPTNRRPFGFDWEDWGRLDAIEVLEHATRELQPDPTRIYLTGHSMGGHGTWIIGSLLPDRFAAIGPSAGWISFSTYATTRPASTQPASKLADLVRRAASPSDTSLLFANLAHLGVYMLHGADDDNVPADQARQMVEHLGKFHHDFVYHEQPKAGHWWESSDEPGAECVDWPAMFDFFARHRRPAMHEVRQVDFVTPSPSVSATCHWATIEAQLQPIRPSSISIRLDPGKQRYIGMTHNVARLRIELHPMLAGAVQVELDGQTITIPEQRERQIWLGREVNEWKLIDKPSPNLKNPARGGPFKDAFRNRMIFVYGTRGTAEENAWALNKARFDAETWWYRGNGAVDVISDTEFEAQHARDPKRNVILYGNATTLACWDALLRDSPVHVSRERIRIGERELSGDDLACLLVRPRPGSDVACVAVIGGTGLRGLRTTDRLPVFLSGVAYPDVTVLNSEVFEKGWSGVRCAGFFGNDWSVESGEFEWRPED